MKHIFIFIFTIVIIVLSGCSNNASHITVGIIHKTDETIYALEKMEAELNKKGINVKFKNKIQYNNDLNIIFEERTVAGAEDYRIEKHSGRTDLVAGTPIGAMYGILTVTDYIKAHGSMKGLPEGEVKAALPFRAIKFNLPWFSYRRGENLQLHYETCRDTLFWEGFLDMMAENKFNALTLWNLHPFIFMVKPTNFPEASPFSDEEMGQWKKFWNKLFAMAKQRGIETYVVNWNIFVSEEFSKNYGVAEYSREWGFWGSGDTSKVIQKYTRELVTQTINEYPDLTGIGITLGERMGDMTVEERRRWIDRTIIKGMQDANRKAKLIYRAPLSAGTGSEGSTSKSTEILTRDALEKLSGIETPVWVEFKYNWSHGHSSPKLSIVHGGKLTDTYWNPEPKNYTVIWTVRNEDFFVLRWCRPDFIREFMKNNTGNSYNGGCIIGSECYIPAKDYLSKPEYACQYAWQRQWLFYKAWGNLLYNPQQNNNFLVDAINSEFAVQNGEKILEAWQNASATAHHIASFYQGTWDGALYTEGFSSWRDGGAAKFIRVDQLINRPTLDSLMINIQQFVELNEKVPDSIITPYEVADMAEENAQITLRILTEIEHDSLTVTLKMELNDMKTWAYLGLYFANKVRGATAYAKFLKTGDKEFQTDAVIFLEKALKHWKDVVEHVEIYNRPTIPYMFDEQFSWRKQTVEAERDVAIVKAGK